VSVHPPLSAILIGAMLLTMRRGRIEGERRVIMSFYGNVPYQSGLSNVEILTGNFKRAV
jgi:hypothetical protein